MEGRPQPETIVLWLQAAAQEALPRHGHGGAADLSAAHHLSRETHRARRCRSRNGAFHGIISFTKQNYYLTKPYPSAKSAHPSEYGNALDRHCHLPHGFL